MFSLSIYQSYIGVTIGLCLMISVVDLIRNEKNIKEILLNILKTAIVALLGGILYYIVTKIILLLSNSEINISNFNMDNNIKFKKYINANL